MTGVLLRSTARFFDFFETSSERQASIRDPSDKRRQRRSAECFGSNWPPKLTGWVSESESVSERVSRSMPPVSAEINTAPQAPEKPSNFEHFEIFRSMPFYGHFLKEINHFMKFAWIFDSKNSNKKTSKFHRSEQNHENSPDLWWQALLERKKKRKRNMFRFEIYQMVWMR